MDDPLWLNSPGKRLAFRGACYGLVLAFGAVIGGAASGSAWGALATATGVLCLLVAARDWLPRSLAALFGATREHFGRHREGVHHCFAGEPLDVHDDGRAIWLHERGLRRLLGLQRDPPDAFKARFAGQWREARELGLKGGGVWLNADGVHRFLADAPERMDPRRIRLRGYLDREILQPAARRRAR